MSSTSPSSLSLPRNRIQANILKVSWARNQSKQPTHAQTATFHSKSFKNAKIKAALRTHTRVSDRLPRSPAGTEGPDPEVPGRPRGARPPGRLPRPPPPIGPRSGGAGEPVLGTFSGARGGGEAGAAARCFGRPRSHRARCARVSHPQSRARRGRPDTLRCVPLPPSPSAKSARGGALRQKPPTRPAFPFKNKSKGSKRARPARRLGRRGPRPKFAAGSERHGRAHPRPPTSPSRPGPGSEPEAGEQSPPRREPGRAWGPGPRGCPRPPPAVRGPGPGERSRAGGRCPGPRSYRAASGRAGGGSGPGSAVRVGRGRGRRGGGPSRGHPGRGPGR